MLLRNKKKLQTVTRNLSSRVLAPNTEEPVELCLLLCFVMDEEYRLYVINPETVSDDTYPAKVCRMPSTPSGSTPSGSAFTVVHSKIYLIGGGEDTVCNAAITDPLYSVPSSNVYVYDIQLPERGWEDGIPMIGGKGNPIVASAYGKIYVLGCSLGPVPSEPCAEVFDLNHKCWLDLPYPPPEILSAMNNNPLPHVFIENSKKILVNCNGIGAYSFDLEKEWQPQPKMAIPDEFSLKGSAKVVVDEVLYTFYSGRLYASDLASKSRKVIIIYGLEDKTDTINPDFTKVFLFHLGKGKLCLVWCQRGFVEKQRIWCLTFCIQQGDGNYHVVIEQSGSYLMEGVHFVDCLAVARKTFQPLLLAKASDSYFPGNFLGSSETSHTWCDSSLGCVGVATHKVTRHARRVYLGGVPKEIMMEAIVHIFIQLLHNIGAIVAAENGGNDIVLDIYVNDEKKFAIVEMGSVELASDAMALDGAIVEAPGHVHDIFAGATVLRG